MQFITLKAVSSNMSLNEQLALKEMRTPRRERKRRKGIRVTTSNSATKMKKQQADVNAQARVVKAS
jgi:hypothetical protein